MTFAFFDSLSGTGFGGNKVRGLGNNRGDAESAERIAERRHPVWPTADWLTAESPGIYTCVHVSSLAGCAAIFSNCSPRILWLSFGGRHEVSGSGRAAGLDGSGARRYWGGVVGNEPAP